MTTTQGQAQQNGRLKVVLEELEQGMTVGIQAKGCDPFISVLAVTTLDEALTRVPELVAQAREQWAQQPQYPAYQRPPEPRRQTPAQDRVQHAPDVTQTRLM